MIQRFRTIGLLVLVALLAAGVIRLNAPSRKPSGEAASVGASSDPKATGNPTRATTYISALGYLTPAGDIRRLSPPAQRVDGTPILESLYVEEGQRVRRNQLLASFDNLKRVDSEINTLNTRISSLQGQIGILENETQRYRLLSAQGAYSSAELETRELRLLELKSQLKQVQAERKQAETERSYGRLLSPIDGMVLKIFVREGERAGPQGVMEIGANQQMEAIAQVSEDHIGRIKTGQRVSIMSENSSFPQTLQGRVIRIASTVSQRLKLTLDTRADSDVEARTVEVRMALAPEDLAIVQDLAGAKIRVTFQP
ncbi:efflux RND transporter periplasmic adaptor subunit [Vulcanococcus limneticus]|uniref:efflux RND transporter periplasmic adaptor subunit n=1 Tax=Vulcanococcus limneticus TaxID=2170428 RepID=UPI0012FF976D|nr:efflux RND transporter periplasmic adaptor subunit [Vulcanococcus limneticus]MCP9792837.1 efflux RND transporter periplasmic adaptor subunit [Vulcanococcus limneticus MW73D5]MCP9894835.1 efflux RND transporter periplasmic adaptor subunit [Vulcanococcus limneticus Candia 3F8]MCP9898314.1 efflux RND transporter periplasmic adaptor subunit [Vulcanococcus limneticus Candia 3B3]